jgi:hypothetical protein
VVLAQAPHVILGEAGVGEHTALDEDVVWGTMDGDNIVWGTMDDDNIVWGTSSKVTVLGTGGGLCKHGSTGR